MTNEELAAAIKSGQNDLMEQLWDQCYFYIKKQAERWAYAWKNRIDFDAEDLIQSGYIALVEAVNGFEPEGSSFIVYLRMHLFTEFQKVVGVRTSKRDALDNAISIETPVQGQNDGDREQTIADTIKAEETGFEAAEDAIFRDQLASVVHEAVESLPERQCIVIDCHYLQGKSYSEIGEELCISCSRVGILCKKGLKALKRGKFSASLQELLFDDRNLYQHTGLTAFKESGCSSPEWELLRMERTVSQFNARGSKESKILYAVDRLGWSRARAERVFSV